MTRISILFLFIATSAFANYPLQVSVLLDAGATSLTVQNAGTGGSDVLMKFSPSGSDRVRFSITPGLYIPPPDGTTYSACAAPCAVSVNRNWGQQYYWVEYVDSSGNPYTPRKLSQSAGSFKTNLCNGVGTLPQVKLSTITTSPMPMPIVVVGQDCYVADYQFSLVNLTGFTLTGLRLYLRVHNPDYNDPGRPDGKVSVQFNNTGSWLTLTNAAATPIDEAQYYGAIGSFDQVREFTLPIPNGTIESGHTTVTMSFRFNGTEGITSGYRVLSVNIVEASKTLSSIGVSSNVATGNSNSHGFSSGNTVLIYGAPGMYMRFNGLRTLTGVATNTFTFAPCGTGNAACTSPNGTYTVPTSTDTRVTATSQPVMYAARCLIAATSFTTTDPLTWTAGSGNATTGGNWFKFGNSTGTAGQTDQLKNPNLPYFNDTLHFATCGGAKGCHTFQGTDLKRFAYDNWAIKQRVIFHGLNETAADDIIAYIRGLNVGVPTNGRPWNPQLQPGPGLSKVAWARDGNTLTNIVVSSNVGTATMSSDPGCSVGDEIVISGATVDTDLNGLKIITSCGSNTVVFSTTSVADGTYTESTLIASQAAKFFAGCGRDCVLTYAYEDLREYLFADTSKLVWDARLEVRDIPVPYAFSDWNEGWLPVIHPADGFPSSDFLNSSVYLDYIDIANNMTANSFSSLQTHDYGRGQDIALYRTWVNSLPGALYSQANNYQNSGNWYPAPYGILRASVPQFARIKFYEIAVEKQTYQFGGQSSQAISGGNKVPTPNWPLIMGHAINTIFSSAFHKFTLSTMLDCTNGCLNTNAKRATADYESNSWYWAEPVRGGGNGFGGPDAPIDDAYLQAFETDTQKNRPGGYMAILYHTIVAPQNGNIRSSFFYYDCAGCNGTDFGATWSQTYNNEHKYTYPFFTTSRWTELADQVLTNINTIAAAKTTAYWGQIFSNAGCISSTPASAATAWARSSGNVQDSTAMLLPFFKVWGVNAGNLTTYLNWIKSLTCSSTHNWDADLAAGSNGTGETNGAQAATGDLTAGVGRTISFGTCPSSKAQADHDGVPMYTIWSGTGQFESMRPTGGTCTQGNPGTLIFDLQYNHTGAWKISWGCDVGIPPNWPFNNQSTDLPWWRCSNMF